MARTKQKVLDDKRAAGSIAEPSAAAGSEAPEPTPTAEVASAKDVEPPHAKPGDEGDEGEEEEEEEEFVVECIVAQRYVRNKLQYEVKWKDDEETSWEPEAHLANTEALEEWLKVSHANAPVDDGGGDSSSSSDDDDDDKASRKRKRTTARDSDYSGSDADSDDDEDSSDAEYVPEFTGAARIGGSSSKRQKAPPALNDRQKDLIHDDILALSKLGLAKAFEALVAARPEVYASARGLLKRQLEEEEDDDDEAEEKEERAPQAKELAAVAVEGEVHVDEDDVLAAVEP